MDWDVFFPKWNVEYLVTPNQQYVLDMSLFFVHNAKRLMPLSCSVEEGKVITVNQKKDHISSISSIKLVIKSIPIFSRTKITHMVH